MPDSKLAEIMKEETLQTAALEKEDESGEKKSTQITYYFKLTHLTHINQSSVEKYGSKRVYEATLECTRKIEAEKIRVGQSFSVFPRNSKADVDTVLNVFGWAPDELIGNETTVQVLERVIDLKS